MSSVGSLSLTEQVAHKIAIIMLESPVRDEAYNTAEAQDYNKTYLCGEHDL